jgi:hypothetical protein
MEKLIVAHVFKIPGVYGNRKPIIVFAIADLLDPVHGQLEPVHTLASVFFKIHVGLIFFSPLSSVSHVKSSLQVLQLKCTYVQETEDKASIDSCPYRDSNLLELATTVVGLVHLF